MAELPPVVLRITTEGIAEAREQIKSLRDATLDLARAQQTIAASTAAASTSAGGTTGRHKPKLDLFGNKVGSGGDRGLRQLSSSRALQDMFGKTTARLLGLQGPMGQVIAAFGVMHTGVSLASRALSQFGSYILRDIIKPQLDLGMRSSQIANRMGGGATGNSVRREINDLQKDNAQSDLKTLQNVYEKVSDIVKDPVKTKEVSALALQANKAYGVDAGEAAEMFAKQRAANPNMDSKQFAGMINGQVGIAKANGTMSLGDMGSAQGAISNLVARFPTMNADGTQNQGALAARTSEMTALLAAGTAKGSTVTKSATGLRGVMDDLKRNPKFGGTYADGEMKPMAETLGALMRASGGNLNRLGGGPKGMALGQIKIGDFKDTSTDWMRSAGIDQTYRAAEAKQKGSGEGAVVSQLNALAAAAMSATTMLNDTKKVDADPEYKLQAAMVRLKQSLVDSILPVLENQGPKIAAAIESIADGLSKADLVGTMTSVVQAVAGAMYGLMDILPDSMSAKIGGGKTKAALASAAGIDTARAVDPAEADRMLKGNASAQGTWTKAGLGILGAASPIGLAATLAKHALSPSSSANTAAFAMTPLQASKSISHEFENAMKAAAQKMGAAGDKIANAVDKIGGVDPARGAPLPSRVGI